MNRTIIIGTVVGAVIFIGALYYLWPSAKQTPTQQTQSGGSYSNTVDVATKQTSAQQTQTQSSGSYSNTSNTMDVTATKSPTPAPIQDAFMSGLGDNPDHMQPIRTVTVGNYAVTEWKGISGGGEALLQFDTTSRSWKLLTYNGGLWSLDGLVAAGVPLGTAQALIAQILHY